MCLSSTSYNNLPLIQEQNGAVLIKELEAFGDLLAKHRATDAVAVSLIHRHFELSPNEIMVHSTAETANGYECKRSHGPFTEELLPHSVYFDRGFVPYEYVTKTSWAGAVAFDAFHAIITNKDFVREFGNLVGSKTMVYGLRPRHVEWTTTQMFMESPLASNHQVELGMYSRAISRQKARGPITAGSAAWYFCSDDSGVLQIRAGQDCDYDENNVHTQKPKERAEILTGA